MYFNVKEHKFEETEQNYFLICRFASFLFNYCFYWLYSFEGTKCCSLPASSHHPLPQIVHMVCKWRYGNGLLSSGAVSQDVGDRRQSVSRQPSFTLSEWTDAQEDLLDIDPVPQTPVFEMRSDTRTEGDATTLTVTPVGLQERLDPDYAGRQLLYSCISNHIVKYCIR